MNTIENLPFSKRYDYVPKDIPFQIDDMDETLRNEFFNVFVYHLYEKDKYSNRTGLYEMLWFNYFKKPIDEYPKWSRLNEHPFRNYIKKYIIENTWYFVYDLFESLMELLSKSNHFAAPDFCNAISTILERNYSGYTLINNKFVPITNESEISEIKNTQYVAVELDLLSVQAHLNTAIKCLSQKPNPDYRNSIKESISMVESIARKIQPNARTLGEALKCLEKKSRISSPLKEGFEKLYGYTNGADGIRHALMDDNAKLEIEDARFFLVSCSAFTNYLIAKARNDGLLQSAV